MNPKARQRAELIFQVRSGQVTATAAAQRLGISRQQYYQWEKRALEALLQALEDQPTGRPKGQTDPEKQTLQHRVAQLEQQVQHYEQKEKLRQLVNQWEASRSQPGPPAKKTRNDPPNLEPAPNHQGSESGPLARTLPATALLQRDALAPSSAIRPTVVANTRTQKVPVVGLGRVLPAFAAIRARTGAYSGHRNLVSTLRVVPLPASIEPLGSRTPAGSTRYHRIRCRRLPDYPSAGPGLPLSLPAFGGRPPRRPPDRPPS